MSLSKSVIASKDNADLANELDLQNEILLTRNKPTERQTMTHNNEARKEGSLDHKIELNEEKSINLTDFKSFQAASEYSKNIMSSQAKDVLLEQENIGG